MLSHVFSFLLHQRPTYSMRSPQSLRKSLANVCESVLVDTLAALLQSGVPVLYNAHLFGPELIRCALILCDAIFTALCQLLSKSISHNA